MTTLTPAPPAGRLFHRPVATGPAFWGPGDHYTFLVTDEDSGGAYFAMEALVPPGGGPPPHIHTREGETFYLLEGRVEFLLGEETIVAGPGDFVNVPRGTVHRFQNTGTEIARLVLTFTAGRDRELVRGDARAGAERAPAGGRAGQHRGGRRRYVAAAPRYGLEFV